MSKAELLLSENITGDDVNELLVASLRTSFYTNPSKIFQLCKQLQKLNTTTSHLAALTIYVEFILAKLQLKLAGENNTLKQIPLSDTEQFPLNDCTYKINRIEELILKRNYSILTLVLYHSLIFNMRSIISWAQHDYSNSIFYANKTVSHLLEYLDNFTYAWIIITVMSFAFKVIIMLGSKEDLARAIEIADNMSQVPSLPINIQLLFNTMRAKRIQLLENELNYWKMS